MSGKAAKEAPYGREILRPAGLPTFGVPPFSPCSIASLTAFATRLGGDTAIPISPLAAAGKIWRTAFYAAWG